MFETKSPVTKVFVYIIIVFFSLIFIISFGMSDVLSKLGLNQSIAARVNGEDVHIFDFNRYRSRYPNLKGKQMDDYLLNRFISEIMLRQEAKRIGFNSTDEKIVRYIWSMREFKNPATGKFDKVRMKYLLENNRMTFNDLEKMIRENLVKENLFKMISMGLTVSDNEIMKEYQEKNSKIQLKYSFISNFEINKRNKTKIFISQKEIEAEFNKLKKKPTDAKKLKSEKEKIKKRLESKKLNELKNKLIQTVNKLANEKKSFNLAQNILRGSINTTNTAIGFYIFTPIKRDIKNPKDITEEEKSKIKNQLLQEKLSMIVQNLMIKLSEKAKITKNLKTN